MKVAFTILTTIFTFSIVAQSAKPVVIEQNRNTQAVYQSVPMNYSHSAGACWNALDASYTDLTPLWSGSYSALDDGSYGAVALGFNFEFYGQTYNSIYINVNGNVTFGSTYSAYSASGFPSSSVPAMIAPFWGDVDLRGTSTGTNKAYYKLDSNKITIQWVEVGYYNQNTDVTNTFQLVLTDGTDPDVGIGFNTKFAYDDMNWCVGDASGGTNGFGSNVFATVGAQSAGGANYYQIGLFGENNYDYDGAGGNLDGVHYLDGNCFTMDLSGTNVPPVANGFPYTQEINLCAGTSFTLSTNFSAPEVGQTTTTTVINSTLNDFTAGVTNGNFSTQNITINTVLADTGTHHIIYTATDNGTPGESTIVDLVVNVYDCASFDGPSSLEFDGTDDYVVVPNSSTFSPGGQATIDCWVRPDAPSGTGDIPFIEKEDQYFLGLDAATNTAKFKAYVGGSWYTATATSALTTDKWNHVAGVFTGSEVKIMIDGVEQASTSASGTINNTGNQLYIGGNVPNSKYFSGRLDEIRIWNKGFTAAEIFEKRFEKGSTSTAYLIADFKCDENEGAVLTNSETNVNGSLSNFNTNSCWEVNFANLWVGAADSDYHNMNNWAQGMVPLNQASGSLEASQFVIVNPAATGNSDLIVSNAVTINSLVVNDNANVEVTSTGNLKINQDLYSFESPSYDGPISFVGTTDQYMYGTNEFDGVNIDADVVMMDDQNIWGALILNTGQIDVNGKVLTIRSDANKTGSVFHNSGNIVGDVTMERYVDHQANTYGFHYFSSPISGMDFNDVNDDVNLVGFGGNAGSLPFPNIWQYDESVADTNFLVGWEAPASINSSVVAMRGYGIAVYNPFTLDFTGTLHDGSYSRNLTNTSSGNVYADGWNFVGNPYPSMMNWNLVNIPSGMDNAVYYWDYELEQYASYIDGVGANGGNATIGTMQGFYVHANSNTTLSFDNTVRTTEGNNGTFYKAGTFDYPETIKMKVEGLGMEDETVIRFADFANDAFEEDIDAYKLFGGALVPKLYTMVNIDNISINTLDTFMVTKTVPLFLQVGTDGNYDIMMSFKGMFDDNVDIILEDAELGVFHDLNVDGPYSFSYTTTDSPDRFYVHFIRHPEPNNPNTAEVGHELAAEDQMTDVVENPLTQVNIYSYEDRIVVAGMVVPGQVEVFNMLGENLVSQTIQLGENKEVSMHQYAEGYYVVQLSTEKGIMTEKVYIQKNR